MITYIYDGSPDGLFSAAATAFRSKELPDRVFSDEEVYQPVLFDEVIEVFTEEGISERAKGYLGKNYHLVIHAYLFDTGVDTVALVRCLCELYRDKSHLDRLDFPDVKHVFDSAKRTSKEKMRMIEFVRFEELNDGTLFSQIEPCANVLGLIAEHFIKRLGSESWMIYDRIRKILMIYKDKQLTYFNNADMTSQPKFSPNEQHFQDLWKTFFKQVSIKERENPKLQKQFVPDKYRHLMTEFGKD